MNEIVNGITVDKRSLSDAVRFRYENGGIYVCIKRGYCAYACRALILCDETGSVTDAECVYDGICGDRDRFYCHAGLDPGLYYVTFRVDTGDKEQYVHSIGDEISGELRGDIELCGRFQLLVTPEYAPVDPAFINGNMYHVFVDRFRKSGKAEKQPDAVYVDDWENGKPEYTEYPGENMPNNTFFGGDLYGVTEKLDYIKSLGCNIIYLSPIFKAFSNHKYDTGDYTEPDGGFGGMKAFTGLCEEAHKRGMKIILDGVFNHTGDNSVYFNKYKKYGPGGAYNDKSSPYYSWYIFNSYPDDYDCWWGVKALPKLKPDVPGIIDFFTGENGIIRRYLRLGADGWRLDVADELSEKLLDGIKKAACKEKPGSVILGEVWEDASNKISYGKRRHYFSRAQLDSVMDYPLKDAVIRYVKSADTDAIKQVFVDVYRHYPDRAKPLLMNFLGTHDTERIITVLGGEPAGSLPGSVLVSKKMTGEQYDRAKQRLFVAFSLLCFLPGIVSVYYGDEAGLQGYRDPFNRMPYPWGKEDDDIRSKVSELLNGRKDYKGDAELIYAGDGLLTIKRGGHIYISNTGEKEKSVMIPDGYVSDNANDKDDTAVISPMSYRIYHR